MSWLLWMVLGVLVYQLAVLVLVLGVWRNPQVAPGSTPASIGSAFSEVEFPTANGRTLRGWWVSGGDGNLPAILLVHGWGRNTERMLPYFEMFRSLPFHLLAFDARHHGRSDRDGFASMKKFSEDIRAAAGYLASRSELGVTRVGVLGLSIGGAAAIHAAAHDSRLGAVVTVGAFAHPRDAMTWVLPLRWLLAPALPLTYQVMEWRLGVRLDELAPERHVARTDSRLLIIHGDGDATVPVAHARRLAAAADGRAELWVIPGRGHSDPHLEPGFPGRVSRFFLETLGSCARQSKEGRCRT